MQARRIIIAVAGVAVLALVVVLLLQSRGGQATTLSPDQKARALAEYQRRSRLSEPPRPAPEPAVRRPRRTVRRKPAEAEVETAPPRPAAPQPALARTMKATQLAPAVKLGKGSGDGVKEATEEVRKSYDTGNYVDAQKLSLEAVQKSPRNIKLLRYVVSSSCAVGEVETARQYAERLPKRDRDQMAKRCRQNWGAEL